MNQSILLRLWQQHRRLSVAFLAALALALFFALRLLVFAPFWFGPPQSPGPLAGWMTPRFVVHAWHLPPEILIKTLGMELAPKNPQTLREIALAKGVALSDLIGQIDEVILRQHSPGKPPDEKVPGND